MCYNLSILDLTEEQNLFKQGYKLVAGIDEAGRGPLAGPVVAACVVCTPEMLKKIQEGVRNEEVEIEGEARNEGEIHESRLHFLPRLHPNNKLKLIKDSKKLTAKVREELFGIIKQEFTEVGIGICDHQTIDRINILQAAFLAMKKAIGALKQKPDFIMLDGKQVDLVIANGFGPNMIGALEERGIKFEEKQGTADKVLSKML